MKANQFTKNNKGYAKAVGGLVALLITIIIAILVYWSASPAIISSDTQYQTYTGYSHGDNGTAWGVTLPEVPNSAGDVNVTCWSSSANAESYPTFALAHTRVTAAADAANNFTQVNISYTTRASNVAGGTNTMASTVFGLLPIIAIVVIGSILIALIVGFGGKGRRT